jgi:CRP/FNR family transcriptional regulator
MNVDWTERFQGTSALPGHVRNRLVNVARLLRFEEGTQVFGPTNIPDSLFFLYDGRIRVSQSSDNGREITLYRVDAGESCVLTTACMLAEEAYSAEGVAETDITLVALPKLAFEQLVSEEVEFRDFVFAAYSKRLIDLLRVVDDVAFGHMDIRLAERLLVIAGDRKEIAATHQHLASELGTAREVVSRVLSDFQKRQIVGQSRGRITLIDKKVLKELASKH